MSDRHLRLLRLVAQYRQRDLDGHDAVGHAGDMASRGRRQDLLRTARQTRVRVTEAQGRRRRRPPDRLS